MPYGFLGILEVIGICIGGMLLAVLCTIITIKIVADKN